MPACKLGVFQPGFLDCAQSFEDCGNVLFEDANSREWFFKFFQDVLSDVGASFHGNKGLNPVFDDSVDFFEFFCFQNEIGF